MQVDLGRVHLPGKSLTAKGFDAVRRAPLAAFFVLTFGLTWAWWLPLALTGRTVVQGNWRPTHMPGEFGPLIAALSVIAIVQGRAGLRGFAQRAVRWRVSPRWWLAAASPLIFSAVAVVSLRLVRGAWPNSADLRLFSGSPQLGPVGMWLMLVNFTGFGEEGGWRGFATPRLQRRHSPLRASLILAVFWMLWHAPAFVFLQTYRDLSVVSYPGFFIGLACGAIVLTWLYNRSGGSLLLVAVWHGSYDFASGVKAADGAIAAIVSTVVMALAALLVILEIRAGRRGAPSVLGAPPDDRDGDARATA